MADLILSINAELQQAAREIGPIVELGITLNGNKAVRTAAREAFDRAGGLGALLEQSLRHLAAGPEPEAAGTLEASATSYAAAIKDAVDAASTARDLLLADRLAAVTDAHATALRLVAGATFVDTNLRAAERAASDSGSGDAVAAHHARDAPARSRATNASPIADFARALATYFDRSVVVTSQARREIQRNLPDLTTQAENRSALAAATGGASELVRHRPDPAKLVEAMSILSHCAGVAGFARDDLTVIVVEDEAAAATRSLATATRRMANAAHIAHVNLRWSAQHHELATSAVEIIRTAGGGRAYRTTSFNRAVDNLMTIAAKSAERSTEATLLAALLKGRVAELLEAGAA